MKRLISTWLIFLPLLWGCDPKDEAAIGSNRDIEQKPPVLADSQAGQGPTTSSAALLSLPYALSLYTRSGARLCSGDFTLSLNEKFQMTIPTFMLRCLGILINAGSLINNLTNSDSGSTEADGKTLRTTSMGGYTFSPSRPLVIGPVVQNPNLFANFYENKSYVVTGPQSGRGEIEIRVRSINSRFSAPLIVGQPFDKVIHWEMNTRGFGGIEKSKAFLFDHIEFYWNIRPIAIPKIIIVGNIKSFLPPAGPLGGGLGGVASALLGTIRIELDLKKMPEN